MSLDWEVLLARLADELTAKGKLSSPRWQAAFRATPRHVFVPDYFEQDSTGSWQQILVDGDDEALAKVYSNAGLFTDVDTDGRGVSSSSTPGLMTRMLELLDVRDDDRVLEIGTGTGYNTALLCAGLSDEQVFSIDIDYTEAARQRLASLGYRPALRTGDGISGIPNHAPFDRIIATVAITHIPAAWLDQLVDDGTVLADVKLNPAAGNLVLLRKRGHVAEGRFDAGQAWFMDMRHPNQPDPPTAADRASGTPERSTTNLPAVAWEQPVPWFLTCLTLGTPIDVGYRLDDNYRPVAARVSAHDGSWAEIDTTDTHPRAVTQAGPTRLWDAVEHAIQTWNTHDRPTWDRLGLTVTTDEQRVWLDSPDGPILGRLGT
ncbi:methyltransferase domain-containing protein [Actinophytocola sp.]|uniref:methyltransferase domain-containing protein n=1 Tax=Actinophytocola sp. TaxID=1872138 RepID=UPI0025BEB72C|nr:methyltransferase domain-containing protein [Actinophytocola sp.]